MANIITIFGLAGTGTSSCGKQLAEKLGYKFVSAGQIVREKAEEKNLTLGQYEQVLNTDPNLDRELDERVKQIGESGESLVMDSRLAWYFIPHSFKVKLTCRDDVRIERVAKRDRTSVKEARGLTADREDFHNRRYMRTYGIEEYDADSNFDLILDTTNTSVDETVEKIIEHLNSI